MFSLPQEWRRTFFSWQQRHRLLVARFTFLVASTSLVALVGTAAIYFLERHAPGTEIKTVFDALYFTTVPDNERAAAAQSLASWLQNAPFQITTSPNEEN